MSSKAIYHIIEQEQESWMIAPYGANALSPLLRLIQTQEISRQMPDALSIGHIFSCLTYGGKYIFPRLPDDEMFCLLIPDKEVPVYNTMFHKTMEIDMRITLDIPQNNCLLEFNENTPSFKYMENRSIPLSVGIDNVKKLCREAERQGVKDFSQLCRIYYTATGLSDALEKARGNYEVEELYTAESRQNASERLINLSDEELEV